MIKYHSEPITIFKPKTSYFEQSSKNIWNKVCECVKNVTADIIDKSEIKGIGFDATCSLVLLDKNNEPLTASPTNNNDQNIRSCTRKKYICHRDYKLQIGLIDACKMTSRPSALAGESDKKTQNYTTID